MTLFCDMHKSFPFYRSLATVAICLVIIALACNRDKRHELFTIQDFIDFEIPPGLNTFETHFFVTNFKPSRFQAQLEASNADTSDIIAIEARRAFLTTVFQDVNLDFIHRVSVYIFDPFNPSDRIEFLYLDPVPFRDKTSIQLFPGIADISQWIMSDYFGIEVRLHFREITPTLAQMRLEFDVRVLGN